ncbi:hypothetical protein [Streptomyces sp. NPDC005805]|uniref:hypothetical protein n=1 Tax=Streptomyces sp. NPDC005805 TaxID=3157068 RepID=UPI00340DBBD5
MIQRIPQVHGDIDILLEDTYEKCMDALLAKEVDLALVAHAYHGINAFHMNPDLEPSVVFRGHTPEYGLAVRSDFAFDEELLSREPVVSHPAPIPLLRHHVDRPVTLVTVDSTSQAAGQVADGRYSIAITNEQAVRRHNLRFVRTFSRIPMTWTIFSRKAARP